MLSGVKLRRVAKAARAPPSQWRFNCTDCDKTFATDYNLRKHVERKHPLAANYAATTNSPDSSQIPLDHPLSPAPTIVKCEPPSSEPTDSDFHARNSDSEDSGTTSGRESATPSELSPSPKRDNDFKVPSFPIEKSVGRGSPDQDSGRGSPAPEEVHPDVELEPLRALVPPANACQFDKAAGPQKRGRKRKRGRGRPKRPSLEKMMQINPVLYEFYERMEEEKEEFDQKSDEEKKRIKMENYFQLVHFKDRYADKKLNKGYLF